MWSHLRNWRTWKKTIGSMYRLPIHLISLYGKSICKYTNIPYMDTIVTNLPMKSCELYHEISSDDIKHHIIMDWEMVDPSLMVQLLTWYKRQCLPGLFFLGNSTFQHCQCWTWPFRPRYVTAARIPLYLPCHPCSSQQLICWGSNFTGESISWNAFGLHCSMMFWDS